LKLGESWEHLRKITSGSKESATAAADEAGLVEGSKIHVDSSLVDADASSRSVKALELEVVAVIERTA
jgi:hypothetical protein